MLPDEAFTHAPETPPPYWQESCFYVAHRPDRPGDALILTVVSQPGRRALACYQMGRLDGALTFARFTRRCGAPATTAVGPAEVEMASPYRRARLRVAPTHPRARFGLDLTWSARTRPHLLPHGSMATGGRLVWDQRHLFQAGWFDGSYTVGGVHRPVTRWWGQRDHSWGVRDHRRAPMWMWLAIQLPDGMLGVWCWEHPDGTRAFCAGCWAPAGDREPVPVTGFHHDLRWTDEYGVPVCYGRDGARVHGLAGRLELTLATGERIGVTGAGTWIARYGGRGGGQHLLAVTTDDHRRGTGIYEVTGCHHHRYFPVPRVRGSRS